jgi:hypothetical protein
MSNGTMFAILGMAVAVQAAISIRWGGKVAALAFAAPYVLIVALFAGGFGYFALRDGFKSVWPSGAEGIAVTAALCGFWTPFGVTAACIGFMGRAAIRSMVASAKKTSATRS